MSIARIERRVEKYQGIPSPAHALRMHRRAHRRHRMENAGRAFGAEFSLHQLKNMLQVANKIWPVMMLKPMRRVLSVIAKVEKYQLVALAQPLPERQVAVDRKAVSMAQREPRPAWISMLADANNRAIFHFGVDRSKRRRHLGSQFALPA